MPFTRFILLLVASATSVSCGLNVYSVSQDKALGADVDQQIRSNPKQYPILDNDRVEGYLQGLVDEILRSPAIQHRDKFAYKVTVINDDRTLNAFATPGGYIYVYTGLLRYLGSEAAIAGVLAHEIAHAEERHATEQMTKDLVGDQLLSLSNVDTKSEMARITATSTKLLATLANSRADEHEADSKAFEYLRTSRFWPGGIKFFFDKMILESGRGSTIFEGWLSTHPDPESRVENINELLKRHNIAAPTPQQLGTERYRSMLRNLR